MEATRSPAPPWPRPASGEADGALWLLSLVDLMLLMLCSFVLLIVVARQDAEPAALAAPGTRAREAILRASTATARDPWVEPPTNGKPRSLPVLAPPTARQETASELIKRYIQYDTSIAALEPALEPAARPVGRRKRNEDGFVRAVRDIFAAADDDFGIDVRTGIITVRLPASITFRSASADLLAGVRPLLDQVAVLLEKNPEVRVEASGHTDDRPIANTRYPSNWDLSAARAVAVARYLLNKAAIDPTRMRIAGYARYAPIDPRTTEIGRARNRRVEIRLEYGSWTGPRNASRRMPMPGSPLLD